MMVAQMGIGKKTLVVILIFALGLFLPFIVRTVFASTIKTVPFTYDGSTDSYTSQGSHDDTYWYQNISPTSNLSPGTLVYNVIDEKNISSSNGGAYYGYWVGYNTSYLNFHNVYARRGSDTSGFHKDVNYSGNEADVHWKFGYLNEGERTKPTIVWKYQSNSDYYWTNETSHGDDQYTFLSGPVANYIYSMEAEIASHDYMYLPH